MKLELPENKRTLIIISLIALVFIGSGFYLVTEDDVSLMDVLETLSLGAISSNVETVKPNVPDYHNYYGTVHNPHLMDSSSGWGEFEADKEGGVYFSNSNDPFTKANYADGYISFKLETMDVSPDSPRALVYLDVYPDGQSSFFLTYTFASVEFDGQSHWKTVTTYQKLSYFDKNNDGIIEHAVLRHSPNERNWVRIYELQWIITFEEPDPCAGKDCDDKCIDGFWATDGRCNPETGRCIYDTKEQIHGKCDYDVCAGKDCSDTCIGYYRATDGHCEGGECIYDTQEKIDGLCNYDVCAGKDCSDTCIGEYRASDGHCEGGECVYDTQEQIDGWCNYVASTPIPDPTPDPTEQPTGDPTPVPTSTPSSVDNGDNSGSAPPGTTVPDTPGEVPKKDIFDKLRENIYLTGAVALILVLGAAYIVSTGGLVNKKKK